MTVLLFTLLMPASPAAQQPEGNVEARFEGQRYEVRYRVFFTSDALDFRRQEGFDRVRLSGADFLTRPGEPSLPSLTVRIALPADMRVERCAVEASSKVDVPGYYYIYPAQPPIRPPGRRQDRKFVPPDPAVYFSPETYPSDTVRFLDQVDLAGQNMAILRITPVQWNPAEGTLTLATFLDIVLEGQEGCTCGDYLPHGATERCRERYEKMVAAMVVNPEDVRLRSSPIPQQRGVGPGQYDYVIITQPDWTDDFLPLADWKTRKGCPTAIVTTDWIYVDGGYTGTDVEKIRAFVVDAHANWGAQYFLLGGDTNLIPYHVRTITVPEFWTDDISNDTYYADYDEDCVCEVHLGRAPLRTELQVASFTNKVLTYEKSPPAGYATTAALLGFDLVECGDLMGEAQNELTRSSHIPPEWTVQTEYDSEPGTHTDDVIACFNAGYHLANYIDHCDIDIMGTGYTCHLDWITTEDVPEFANGDRQTIMFVVGCFSCHFPNRTCLGEAFVKDADGGCIGYMGCSCYGWVGTIEDPDWYTARQSRYFFRNLFDLGIDRLGESFSLAKNDEYNPDDPYNLHQYVFTELHLLGDPELPIWTDDPAVLAVTHAPHAVVGEPTTFPVEVMSGDIALDGATVCLWKDGDLYEIASTTAGIATFEFTAQSEGTLLITVVSQNHLPYEGSVPVLHPTQVSSGANRQTGDFTLGPISPNPFNPSVEIAYSIPQSTDVGLVTLSIYNIQGQRVRSLAESQVAPGTYIAVWDGRDALGREVASGVYLCELRWKNHRQAKQIVLLK